METPTEKRLQALFDRAIDAILFFDDEGRYVDANPAAVKLLELSREEILERSIGGFSSGDQQEISREFRQRLNAAGTVTGEWTVPRADGGLTEIEYRAVADILPGLHVVIVHDITERKAAERSLQQLSRRLLQLQDEERARIAHQLHDTTAQSLAAVRLHLVRVRRSAAMSDPAVRNAVEESLVLTEQSITEVRTLSYLLLPPLIDEVGLLPSLRWYVRGFDERSGIVAELDAPDELGRLSREVETAVFRIVQEGLTNIQRHSGSAVARVSIALHDGELRICVEDEGRGLPHELRNAPLALRSAGVGLAGVDQRARDLGGTMRVQSDDHGTRLEVRLPVREA